MKKLFGSGIASLPRPKNPHSLEYLKVLQTVLEKNETVTSHNRPLIIEALRAISEILIWGDQNDPTVFDYFLEKQMLAQLIAIMKQKQSGNLVSVQLLQTLSIVIENIRNETSLYFLLSNNHINEIISHNFDFKNEEIMAYYISLLKALSFRLNHSTIHFFFNDELGDFPLYTESLRFFNHPECMVRAAVRTITLNVYRMKNDAVSNFVPTQPCRSYFSNLIWHMRNHIVDMDTYLHSVAEPYQSSCRDRLSDMISEHLDHVHYIDDVLVLNIQPINDILINQIFRRLITPIYLGSLVPELQPGTLHVSRVMSLFLLANLTMIVTQSSMQQMLMSLLLFGDQSDMQIEPEVQFVGNQQAALENSEDSSSNETSPKHIVQPISNELNINRPSTESNNVTLPRIESTLSEFIESGSPDDITNIIQSRPIYGAILATFDGHNTDHEIIYALVLLYNIAQNSPAQLLEAAQLPSTSSGESLNCDRHIVKRVTRLLFHAANKNSTIRIVTVELCCLLLRQMILMSSDDVDPLRVSADASLSSACSVQTLMQGIRDAHQLVVDQLTHFYRREEEFLENFEREYDACQRRELRLSLLTSDADLIIPPATADMASKCSVALIKRIPYSSEEICRRCLQIFFLLRSFLLDLDDKPENILPLQGPKDCVKVNHVLDLSKSDLLSCTVTEAHTSNKDQRYLVTDGLQLILVRPDTKKLGFGVAQFVGSLQDVLIQGMKDDSNSLLVKIRGLGPAASLDAKFTFDDHIRCMAAKQRLTKGRTKARTYKMNLIAELFNIAPLSETQPPQKISTIYADKKGKVPGQLTRTQISPKQRGTQRLTDYEDDVWTAAKLLGQSSENNNPHHSPLSKKRINENNPMKDVVRNLQMTKIDVKHLSKEMSVLDERPPSSPAIFVPVTRSKGSKAIQDI